MEERKEPRPELPKEPVISWAERNLKDFSTLPDPEAAIFVTDLALLAPSEGKDGVYFAPDAEVQPDELQKALERYTDGTVTDLPSVPQTMNQMAAARWLMDTLLAADGTSALPKLYYKQAITPTEGVAELKHALLLTDTASAIESGGTATTILRNCRVLGVTVGETKPLEGPPSGLLVAGNMRANLIMGQSQAYYINSSVTVPNWAVYATDGARPVEQPGQKELSVFVYGSDGTVIHGGYGTYSDLFCNVYLFGSTLTVPEIGAISGTFGKLTLGTIGQGEHFSELAPVLTEEDRDQNPEKNRGTIVRSGRTALMIHCVSLPPYWGRPGYSQTELPFHSGEVEIQNSILETDLSLAKAIEYPAAANAYIAHHRGSVILVKSCNAQIRVRRSQLKPDPQGTGAILHTVINSDIAFSVKVPEGTVYPGIHGSFADMEMQGDILHEDYQRDLFVTLENVQFTGKIVTGTVETWNKTAMQEEFPEYIIDPDGYQTVHGAHLRLERQATWTVTGTSSLRELILEPGATIQAKHGGVTMMLNGVPVTPEPGCYRGEIILQVNET